MKLTTHYSDADRTRLVEKSVGGDRWIGPVEREICHKHPTQIVSHRWEWTVGESVESADAFLIESCSLCDEEDDNDVAEGLNGR